MHDAVVDDWLQHLEPRMGALARSARQRILQALPGALETFKAGVPFFVQGVDVFYLEPRGSDLVVAFVKDHPVPDPDGLTQRDAEYGQHLLIRNPSELDGDEVRMLLQRAAAIARHG